MNEDGGHGCLRAKFDLAEGPSNPSTVAVQFIGEGSTASSIDFELIGLGYRVSLVICFNLCIIRLNLILGNNLTN